MRYNYVSVDELVGKKLKSVVQDTNRDGNDCLIFVTESGDYYELGHLQDCCEHVYLQDIEGDLDDLENATITRFEESSGSTETEYGSETWTFYRIDSEKGSVTLRWMGESNGYYSESVDFVKRNLG